MAFSKCTLAAGNVVDSIALRRGRSVRASTGNVYTDNFDLADATIALDGERKLHEVRNAVLAKDAKLGTRLCVAASRMSYNPRHIGEDYPWAWLIVPPDGGDRSK